MNELRNVLVSFLPDPADTIPVRVAGSFKKNGNPAYTFQGDLREECFSFNVLISR